MVARLIGPTVRSGLGSLASATSPLQPNHSPRFCFSASSTPAAKPPAAASPSWIGATRLETTTRRDIDESAYKLLNLNEARGAPQLQLKPEPVHRAPPRGDIRAGPAHVGHYCHW